MLDHNNDSFVMHPFHAASLVLGLYLIIASLTVDPSAFSDPIGWDILGTILCLSITILGMAAPFLIRAKNNMDYISRAVLSMLAFSLSGEFIGAMTGYNLMPQMTLLGFCAGICFPYLTRCRCADSSRTAPAGPRDTCMGSGRCRQDQSQTGPSDENNLGNAQTGPEEGIIHSPGCAQGCSQITGISQEDSTRREKIAPTTMDAQVHDDIHTIGPDGQSIASDLPDKRGDQDTRTED